MNEVVEQTPTGDSTGASVDDKLDRFFAPEPEEVVQQEPQTQGTEQAEEQPQEAAESQPTETQEALEEVEFEGERYQLSPKLKAALMRQQDYTQKTQQVSERERMVALHFQRQQFEQSFQQSVGPENQTLSELEAAIKRYNSVDWQALDTDSLVKTRHALDMLKEQRDEVRKKVDGKKSEFEQKMQSLNQEAMQKANEALSRSIPKWGVEVQKELMNYGQSEGYTDVELGSIRDPRLIKTIWKSQQWDKLQAAKPLAAKRATGVPPVVRPSAAKPVASPQANYQDTIKQLHQAKDPARKKELADKVLDLKLSRMLK